MLLTFIMRLVIFTVIVNYVLADGIFSFNKVSGNNEIVCPNKRTKCKETQTCCATKHNSYHCCRFSNAVCCPDKYHCCPSGTTCDAEKKGCTRNAQEPMEWPVIEIKEDLPVEMLELKPSATLFGFESNSKESQVNDDITCPNNKTKCKDTKTCCITKHGNYYCCPHKNAVCCSDKYNCCPENTKCDLKNKKCLDSSTVSHLNDQISVSDGNLDQKPANLHSVPSMFFVDKLEKKCQNSDKQCPGQKKCCSMAGGKFGCCPFNKGSCCPDMKTCCPHNTECDSAKGACISKSDNLVPLSVEIKRETQLKLNNICPDKHIECEGFQTCCSVGDGLYGCCPFKNATCCADNATCCPHDKVCDVENRVCKKKETFQPSISKLKSLVHFYNEIGLKAVCPDQTKCEKDNSCCAMEGNKFGCCPYNKGVCCEDKKSCCPNGSQCYSGHCL